MLKAVNYPEQFLCISGTDPMTSYTTAIPRTRYNYSLLDGDIKLPVHLTGASAFGRKLLAFVDISQFPHDTNENIHIILSVSW